MTVLEVFFSGSFIIWIYAAVVRIPMVYIKKTSVTDMQQLINTRWRFDEYVKRTDAFILLFPKAINEC